MVNVSIYIAYMDPMGRVYENVKNTRVTKSFLKNNLDDKMTQNQSPVHAKLSTKLILGKGSPRA
jgi:hypothetical protein